MKTLLFFVLIFLANTSALAYKHHIIFVHGLNSNPDVFLEMRDSLYFRLSQFNQSNKNIEWRSYFVEYPTGSLSTYQFAKSLNKDLKEYFETNPLEENDKFSFVTHSQGGLVSGIWMAQAALGRDGFDKNLLKKLDHYITMGTPFWGSQLSKLSSMNEFFGVGFGQKEIEDLSPLSNKVYDSRMALLKVFDSSYKDNLSHIKFVNIVGEYSGFLNKYLGHPGDRIVNAASAHMNFLRQTIECLDNICSQYKNKQELHNISTVYAVDAAHNLFGFDTHEESTSDGLTETPQVCKYNLSCKQPTLNLLAQILLDKDQKQLKREYSRKNNFFSATISLHFNNDFLDEPEIEFQTTDDSIELDDFDTQKITNHIKIQEIYGYNEATQYKNSSTNVLRVFTTGSYKKFSLTSQVKLILRFKKSGLYKELPIAIKNQHNSQIDIDLKKLKTIW